MAGTGVFAEILDEDSVYKYYSDGEWKKCSSGKSVAIINPTTRKTQYKVQGKFRLLYISGSPEDDSSIDKSETLHCFLTQLAAKQRLTR